MTNFKEVISTIHGRRIFNTGDGVISFIFDSGKIEVLYNLHGIDLSVPIATCKMNSSTVDEYISDEIGYRVWDDRFLLFIDTATTITGYKEDLLGTIIVRITVSTTDSGVDNIMLTFKEENGKATCVMNVFNYIQKVNYTEKIS